MKHMEFTKRELTAISNALLTSVEFIHECLRDEPTKKAAMKAFDADAEVTALKKIDPDAVARIREFVKSDLADYLD